MDLKQARDELQELLTMQITYTLLILAQLDGMINEQK